MKNKGEIIGMFALAMLISGMVMAANEAVDQDQYDRIKVLEEKVKALSNSVGKASPDNNRATQAEIEALKKNNAQIENTMEALMAELADQKKKSLLTLGEVNSLKFSGYFDVGWNHQSALEDSGKMSLGLFEFALTKDLTDKIHIAAAIDILDGEVTSMSGVLVDFDLYTSAFGEDHSRGHHYDHTGLILGKFDVPFGLDYLYYTTPARNLISAPFTTTNLFDGGWTAAGVYPHFSFCCFNMDLYYVDSENSLDNDNPLYATGGRIGWKSFLGEIGGSAVGSFDNQDHTDKARYGAHALFNFIPHVEIKSEYVYGIDDKQALDNRSESYYFEGALDTEFLTNAPVSLMARYDAWKPQYREDVDADGNLDVDDYKRWTGGLLWKVVEGLQFKAEHQITIPKRAEFANSEETSAKFVVSF